MVSAVLRLVLITLGTLMVLILAVVSVRQLGSHQAFATPPHAWFQKAQWQIYAPSLEELCAPTFVAQPEWAVKVTTAFRDDGWKVACPEGPRPLADILEKHDDWLLKIEAVETGHLDKLVETVNPLDMKKRFAVLSPSQKVARYLRKKSPQWIFAADSATLLRLQVFESFWLETAMDFWPDFVITPQTDGSHSLLRERSAAELLRRQKRIIWDATSGNAAPEHPIQGIMTTRPSDFERLRK